MRFSAAPAPAAAPATPATAATDASSGSSTTSGGDPKAARIELLAELVAEVSQVPAISTEMLLTVQGAFETSLLAWLHGALPSWRVAVFLLSLSLSQLLCSSRERDL